MSPAFNCDVDINTAGAVDRSEHDRKVMRPLPELTPANEWFWTSGADGVPAHPGL
jgi:hypothetical protein